MTLRLSRRALIGAAIAAAALPIAALVADADDQSTAATSLLVTNSTGRHVSIVDPATGVLDRIEVGAAPWGVALAPGGRAYVSTAEGLAVVDLAARQRSTLIPYQAQSQIDPTRTGEYRPGGMGIAVAPDGRRVYVAVYTGGTSRLEVLDATQGAWLGAVPVGVRPFDVTVARDGSAAYSIDHDSYSVTAIDAATLAPRTLAVAPFGRGAFDKPHYAAVAPDGRLLMPVQGRGLVRLNPASGVSELSPLTADTHQHGVALGPDGRRLLVVGTGPAGGANSGPSLTIYDLATDEETIVLLARPHERVALDPDGRRAYLTGGYLLGSGWDGLTVVDLETRATTEVAVPDRPLDLVVLPAG